MYPSLSGQHVFITGGGSGIGASIVEAFANVGSLVTFVDIDIEASTALADRLDNVTFESCDIRNIETLRSAIPLGRFGTAEEIANLAVFLLSEQAGFITGEVVVADGGFTAR